VRRCNLGLTPLHFAHAAAVVVLAGSFALAGTSPIPGDPPGSPVPAPQCPLRCADRVGRCRLLCHGGARPSDDRRATACRSTYEHDLLGGIARLRRVEYSLRATSVDILIGFNSSIMSIKAVAGANAGMILFDWIQERINPPGRTTPR
jgi:Heliorhodopsin